MSKLDDLIQQYCPDGVEYKPLSKVCQSIKTGRLNANAMVDGGNYPFFTCSDKVYTIDSYSFDTEALLVAGNGYLGNVKYYKGRFDAYQRTYVLSNFIKEVDIMYVYYSMQNSFREFALKSQKDGSVPYITIGIFDNYQIPVPPLPVQEEIVRILDTFTELQAELQAELQKRLQQYNYYRDNLLSFEGRADVEWKKLGDVASIKTGRRFVRTDIKESGVPCFHYGDLYTYYGLTATHTKGYLDKELASKLRFAQPNDVVVVCAGENDMDLGVGVAWLGDEPAVVHDACCILHHNQNPRYISHFLRTHNYHLQMKKYVKNGKISSLPSSGLAEALIPIPSLEEQGRIATILDRFDSLTTDLTSGLPAEIEKRRQQYEYYRDKLLTFKRA